MVEFTFHDKHGRRFWVAVEYHGNRHHETIIDDIEVWIENDTRRRECTKYVPLKLLQEMEEEALDHAWEV